MAALNIDAATPLKTLIAAKTDSSIYVNGGLPTSTVPAAFILIEPNGGFSSNAEQYSDGAPCSCVLSVSVYAKLLTTGAANTTIENIVVSAFQSIFDADTNVTVGANTFAYELATNPIMYTGKSLKSGYSTKIINVNCFINY